MEEFIHHYTEINTLALILKSRSIRFNRLDRVDDVSEADAFQKLNLGEFFFVSSWTYNDSESIPQWKMYTENMSGVRISLPKDMFKYEPLEVPEGETVRKQGDVHSPIPFNKLFTDDYFILPTFIGNKEQFIRKVQYKENFEELKNEAIDVTIDEDEENENEIHMDANIHDLARIASLKNPEWSFQKEIRYVLLAFPSSAEPLSQDYWSQLSTFALKSLYHGKGPDREYIDIKFSEEALDNIKVTLGPRCSEEDYVIVDSLLSKYSPSSELVESDLSRDVESGTSRS